MPGARARVARAGRIYVEGLHDAELVEKVWGDDLRIEGVVVERLDGADHLPDVLADLQPGPGARIGVAATDPRATRTSRHVPSPRHAAASTTLLIDWARRVPTLRNRISRSAASGIRIRKTSSSCARAVCR